MLVEPAAQRRRVVSFQVHRIVARHALRREESNLRPYLRSVASGSRQNKETEQQWREINPCEFRFLNHFGTDEIFEVAELYIADFGKRRLTRRRNQKAEVRGFGIKRGAANEVLCARLFVPDDDGGFIRDSN